MVSISMVRLSLYQSNHMHDFTMVDIVNDFMRQRFYVAPVTIQDKDGYYTCVCFLKEYCVIAVVSDFLIEFDVLSKSEVTDLVKDLKLSLDDMFNDPESIKDDIDS